MEYATPPPLTDPAQFAWIAIMIVLGGCLLARSWSWTDVAQSPPSSLNASLPDMGATTELEVRAKGLEAAGDFEGAMEALLASHRAGSSRAVTLAHELSQRNADAFQAKGCPAHRSGDEAQSLAPVATATAAAAAAGSGSNAESSLNVPRVEDRRDPAPDTDTRGEDEANATSLAAAEEVVAVRKGNGETPWERAWVGPEGFTPPASIDHAARDHSSASSRDTGFAGGGGQCTSTRRNFTVAQLNAFDGGVAAPTKRGGLIKAGKPRPIYIALRGNVYDASAGRNLYGPGGKYSGFAGHDVSRRVARGLRGGESPQNDGDSELDDLSLDGLGRFEKMTLAGWEDTFKARGYPMLGRVIAPPLPRMFTRAELRAFDGRPAPEQAELAGEGGKHAGYAGGQGGSFSWQMPPGYAVPPIYIGVKDKVFDVSFGGSEFYVEGGAYECLAGRDASRVLAKMSMMREDVEGVLDYARLNDRERKNLADWVEKLGEAGKGYPVVGWIDIGCRVVRQSRANAIAVD